MLFDAENLFSEHQAITASAPSDNIIDLSAVSATAAGNDRNLAAGEPMRVRIQATDAFTAAGAATLTVEVQQSADEGFSSPEVLATSGAISKDDLVAGKVVPISFMPANDKRYIRLNYTVATGPMTAGTIYAGLVLDVDDDRKYPGQVGYA